jgi:hypothetical protein
MTRTKTEITSLDDLIRSREFESYQESVLGNDCWINDPDRAKRMSDAAEHGCDGSTPGECIQDWQDFLDSLSFDDDEEHIYDQIKAEIDECYEWHINNGSLDTELG